MKVYWTSIEYNYKNALDNLKGGFFYAFVNAVDVRDALNNFLVETEKIELEIIVIEYITPYDSEMEWESKQQTNHYKKLYKEAKKCNNVIFDNFYAYEN